MYVCMRRQADGNFLEVGTKKTVAGVFWIDAEWGQSLKRFVLL